MVLLYFSLVKILNIFACAYLPCISSVKHLFIFLPMFYLIGLSAFLLLSFGSPICSLATGPLSNT